MKLLQRILLLLLFMVFIQCSNSKFKISKKQVGKINATTTVADLKSIFVKDSLVIQLKESDLGSEKNYFTQEDDVYFIFEKGGKQLLKIVPKNSDDQKSTLQFVQVLDSRYKTDKDISLTSSFKEVHANYRISNIETSFTSVMLYIDELKATIVLDKEEVGIKKLSNTKVTVDQIPDTAKIKYLTIWFD